MRARALLAAAAFAVGAAHALETTQWPPPDSVAARMKDLQETMASPDATAAQREAAREELAGLLKSPAGQTRGRTPGEKPARAAIEPFPSISPPTPAATPTPVIPRTGGVAHLEVVEPSRIVVDPRTGAVASQPGRFAVDPRTGSVLHETPAGFVNPQTGRLVPR